MESIGKIRRDHFVHGKAIKTNSIVHAGVGVVVGIHQDQIATAFECSIAALMARRQSVYRFDGLVTAGDILPSTAIRSFQRGQRRVERRDGHPMDSSA